MRPAGHFHAHMQLFAYAHGKRPAARMKMAGRAHENGRLRAFNVAGSQDGRSAHFWPASTHMQYLRSGSPADVFSIAMAAPTDIETGCRCAWRLSFDEVV